ncbi:hypothetical protein EYF80_036701 [Liparis tanakae]|uniref:Uncharacterized protein n=1 Tax=Liparis tanakae TaxID=230148 RepID=A0A4Z2GIA1_9TELE|nr:hypothetical protein EYF80_036701 [Liparis tanakae]
MFPFWLEMSSDGFVFSSNRSALAFMKAFSTSRSKRRLFPLTSLPLRVDLVAVHGVAAVQGAQVALDGELPVHHGILGHQVRLVEVVRVLHVGSSETWRDASGINKTEMFTGAGLQPVDGVEERGRPPVAGVGGVHALHVRVARVLKQLHEDRLHGLGLVDDGLRADLQAPHAVVGQAVPLHQPLDHRQAQGVDVLAVRAEAHAGLAQAHGVFAGRHAVQLLQLRLVHELRREVQLQGDDAHVFGPWTQTTERG